MSEPTSEVLDAKAVVKRFYTYVKRATKKPNMKKPLTWALYQTWRWVERNEGLDSALYQLEPEQVNNSKSIDTVTQESIDAKCNACGMDRKVCPGCSEVLEIQNKLRQSKLFLKEDNHGRETI